MRKLLIVLMVLVFATRIGESTPSTNVPVTYQISALIEKYSKIYKIPKKYMYALIYQETRYMGPNQKHYKHNQVSSANALGPMQIKLSTAQYMVDQHITRDALLNDVETNIHTSFKIVRKLKNKYKSWALAFGAYNTGKPVNNEYAQNIVNKRYKWAKKK